MNRVTEMTGTDYPGGHFAVRTGGGAYRVGSRHGSELPKLMIANA